MTAHVCAARGTAAATTRSSPSTVCDVANVLTAGRVVRALDLAARELLRAQPRVRARVGRAGGGGQHRVAPARRRRVEARCGDADDGQRSRVGVVDAERLPRPVRLQVLREEHRAPRAPRGRRRRHRRRPAPRPRRRSCRCRTRSVGLLVAEEVPTAVGTLPGADRGEAGRRRAPQVNTIFSASKHVEQPVEGRIVACHRATAPKPGHEVDAAEVGRDRSRAGSPTAGSSSPQRPAGSIDAGSASSTSSGRRPGVPPNVTACTAPSASAVLHVGPVCACSAIASAASGSRSRQRTEPAARDLLGLDPRDRARGHRARRGVGGTRRTRRTATSATANAPEHATARRTCNILYLLDPVPRGSCCCATRR